MTTVTDRFGDRETIRRSPNASTSSSPSHTTPANARCSHVTDCVCVCVMCCVCCALCRDAFGDEVITEQNAFGGGFTEVVRGPGFGGGFGGGFW